MAIQGSDIKRFVKRRLLTTLFYLLRVFPVNKKKIFVKNFYGKGYGENPKYIVDYLINNYEGFDVVWAVKGYFDFPKGVRTVEYSSFKGLIKVIYEQVTAKVWIDNSSKYQFERKRKNQYYINTWHGDIGVKKIGGDVIDKSPLEIEKYRWDSKMIDLLVSGNEWFRRRCESMFFYDGVVATCGYPKRDILLNNNGLTRIVKDRLGLPEHVKVVLYAPTFRDKDISGDKLGDYASSFNWDVIFKSLKEKFGGEWYGMMRLHPNVARYSKDLVLPSNVINVTLYPDISELLCISDCCISDYSSVIFDFAISGKPGFIYATDKKEYEGERGYYFTEEQIPFPVSSEIEELVNNILKFNKDEYLKKHAYFYDVLIGKYPEGHASEYLAKIIFEICNK